MRALTVAVAEQGVLPLAAVQLVEGAEVLGGVLESQDEVLNAADAGGVGLLVIVDPLSVGVQGVNVFLCRCIGSRQREAAPGFVAGNVIDVLVGPFGGLPVGPFGFGRRAFRHLAVFRLPAFAEGGIPPPMPPGPPMP